MNRKYEHISYNYFLLQILPCRSQRKQQMHPKQVFISLLAVQGKCKTVLFSFLSTSLLRQNLLLSKCEALYWMLSLSLPRKCCNGKKTKSSFKVVRCSHEPPHYATFLSHPHNINPANLLTWSRISVLWMVSYTVGMERGNLVKDVWALNWAIFDTPKFSNWCIAKVFLLFIQDLWSWSCDRHCSL